MSVGVDDVRFGLHFQQGLVNQPVGYAVDEGLQITGTDLNLQLSGTANVQGSVDVGLQLGLAYDAGLTGRTGSTWSCPAARRRWR